MKDTKDIEFCIFLNIIYNHTVPEFDEKYFSMAKEFKFLKKIQEVYGGLDLKNCLQYVNDENKFSNFLNACIEKEGTTYWTENVDYYYNLLIKTYNSNKMFILNEKLKNNEIDKSEYFAELNKLESPDEDDLLAIGDIAKIERVEREYTNIEELDKMTKGIEYGTISLWSGVTNAGKTTMMIQFARECILNNKKIFFFAGEQSAKQFKNYLYVTMCKKEELEFLKDNNNDGIYDVKPKDEIIKQFDSIFADKIYIYNNDNKNHTITSILNVMNKAIQKGVRIFFIDNFMQIEDTEKLENQTSMMETIKQFTMRNNIILNLVVHPRKTMNMSSRLTLFDIAGSQNISNKAGNIFSIIRTDNLSDDDRKGISKRLEKNGYDINNCDAIIEVLKTKGNECNMVGVKYNKENKTYRQSYKTISSGIERED